ncbi:hypothetical protein [Streptomyces purpurogeneiscleroticus]|uniref:hypothetical protein n=1 Tax=Streptomyces purpurogeneiscleroticus TaxID=68259 RepID=UPI001CBF4152|nr:hypothetical protein [Streptomyces purpurogeneiscleroticus]MBZ4018804.1 hypothetical protein [Streptomyces purpurogeneiscleroticus]
MAESTLWTLSIAAVTGGTAVLASWVTSRGNTRAARIQAETAADSQRRERLRESRRTAYLDLIEQAHIMGELFWEVSDVLRQPDAEGSTAALQRLSERQTAEYAKLRRCARVVELEGPLPAAAAALRVQKKTGDFHAAIKQALAAGGGGAEWTAAEERFDASYSPFWAALEAFVDTARDAHQGK